MVTVPQTPARATPMPAQAPQPPGTPPAAARRLPRRALRLGEDGPAWLGSLLAYVALTLLASLFEGYGHVLVQPLLLFFFGLSLLSALLPATGPRGQRIAMLPGVGLAMALLLPPLTATLPLLLANALYAGSRDTPAARRGVLGRGVWLLLATLGGAVTFQALRHGWLSAPALSPPEASSAAAGLYAFVYVAGRQVGLRRNPGPKALWKRSWMGARLETAGLLASIPVAILMAQTWALLGISALAVTTGLMALLLLIAHFGFEVALLREQVRAMEKISMVTLSQANPSKVVERFLHLSSGLIPCDRASLWLTDNSQTRLERVARRQSVAALASERAGGSGTGEAVTVRFGEGPVGRVADRQHHLILRAGARDPRAATAEARGGGSEGYATLLLPLVAGGETIGVVQFEREAPGSYTPRDMIRVRSLAGQVAATIANLRMHRDIYNQAVTDGLTGLYNRRHMQTVLLDERLRAARYGHTLSVIMLDVDGFKSYNDAYGHPQGDVLLTLLADLLRQNVREVDVVGRYGGEEFIIVMPETTKQEAWLSAERLRSAVASTGFPGFPDDPEMVVLKTISLGLATFPHDTDDIQTLVSIADQALYRAKRGGRNQVVSGGPSLALKDPNPKPSGPQ